MTYSVLFDKEKLIGVVPEYLRGAGEIYHNVFDGSTEIIIDGKNEHDAIKKATEIRERKKKK